MSLQRLVLTFKPREGVEIRALYRRENGPNPGTKARAREVTALVRTGLERALEGLQGAEIVGTSGFSQREDVVLCNIRDGATLSEHKKVAKGA